MKWKPWRDAAYQFACLASFSVQLGRAAQEWQNLQWAPPSHVNQPSRKYLTDLSAVQSDRGNSSAEVPCPT